jgi:hypothetical protein
MKHLNKNTNILIISLNMDTGGGYILFSHGPIRSHGHDLPLIFKMV